MIELKAELEKPFWAIREAQRADQETGGSRYSPLLNKKGIVYHFGIELIKEEYEILVGRDLNSPVAHCE
jgi:hypothetical protein